MSEDKIFMNNQWTYYMHNYTTLSLEEAYEIYIRPGCGGKTWNIQEKKLFETIKNLTGQENPYIFRFPHKINNFQACLKI